MVNICENQREKYLDIMKGIAILMVINVHFPKGTALFKGITFHLSTFFVVAGILINKKKCKKSFKEFFINKVKSLLYPYLILSIIYIFLIDILIKQDCVFEDILQTISFSGIGSLWFLPTLFIAENFIYFLIKKFDNKFNKIICIILILSLFLSYLLTTRNITGKFYYGKDNFFRNCFFNFLILIMQSFIASGYIGLGYIFEAKCSNVRKKRKKFLFIISSVILFIINYLISLNIKADLHYISIYTPIWYLMGTICGTLAVFCFSYGLRDVVFLDKTLGWFGRNSLIIMTTHLEYRIIIIIDKIISHIDIGNRILKESIIFFIVISIEIAIVNIVNKTRLKYIYKIPNKT